MIDIHKLNPTTFCIVVLWLNGSFSTSMIATQLRTTEGAVKAAYRAKNEGGFLPRRRSFMTRGERQQLLNYLKHYRLDNGLFNRGDVFTAHPISGEPEDEVAATEKMTKRQLRELAREAQDVVVRAERERKDGFAARGVDADPLNWLEREKLLRDPEDVSNKKPERFSEEMRRHECGLRFRKFLEDAELSGFKEVSLELAGKGGSLGVSIPERFIAARSATEALQTMMGDVTYLQAVAVIHHGEFIWDEISTKIGRDIVFEDIRRALDTVALFVGMMGASDFESRWGAAPEILKAKSRDEARDTVRTAREIIREGTIQ